MALKQKDLDALTVDEIKNGVQFFDDELAELEEKVKQFKPLPWWNFSKKKSFKALEKKISKDFQTQIDEMEMEIADLELQHEIIESEYEWERRGTRSKKKRRQRLDLDLDLY